MRRLTGTVVSDKMEKTVIVAVSTVRRHQKYHKEYTVTSRFKAHDERNEYHSGDLVIIEATRPMSRGKRWRVISKTKSAENQS